MIKGITDPIFGETFVAMVCSEKEFRKRCPAYLSKADHAEFFQIMDSGVNGLVVIGTYFIIWVNPDAFDVAAPHEAFHLTMRILGGKIPLDASTEEVYAHYQGWIIRELQKMRRGRGRNKSKAR